MPEHTHSCPGGCGRQVAHQRYACPSCWGRLPADLRRPITATYRRDQAAHGQAMADARRWYRENAATAHAPKRIRLSRAKGWRRPAGAVVVARPTKWGNPYHNGGDGVTSPTVVELYELWLTGSREGRQLAELARTELAGKDLACWCPLDRPCHADVLLAVANTPAEEGSK